MNKEQFNNSSSSSNSKSKKKKILIASLTFLICLSVISIATGLLSNNKSTKIDTTSTADSVKVISTKDSKTINLSSKEKNLISNSSVSSTKKLDPIGKKYIAEHINTKYAKLDKLDLTNTMVVRHLLVDKTGLSDNETIDNFWSRDDAHEYFYTQIVTDVAVYETDDDSDYYVAYINTMKNDDSASVYDVEFAINNNEGQTVDGCIYDKDSGLAYIPKSLYLYKNKDTGKKEIVVNRIQTQLLQAMSVKESNVKSDVNYAEFNNLNSIKNGEADVEGFKFLTKVSTDKNLAKDDIMLSVNGLPTTDFEYNSNTGVITLSKSSLGISTVSVNVDEKASAKAAIKNIFSLTNVSAASSINDMLCAGTVTVPSGVGSGWHSDSTQLGVGYNGNWNQSSYPVYGLNNYDDNLRSYLHSGGVSWGYGNLVQMNSGMYFGVYLGVGNFTNGTSSSFWDYGTENASASYVPEGNWLKLQCAHVASPIGNRPQGNADGWYINNVCTRVLDKSNDYIVVSFVTQKKNTQTGCGIAKFKIRNNGYRVTYNGNGGTYYNSSTWSEPNKVQYGQSYTTWSNDNFFVRPGYHFIGWNEVASGNGQPWQDWTSYIGVPWTWTYTHDVTLYAQWEKNEYTFTYDPNGGTGEMPVDTVKFLDPYICRENTGFKRPGYKFVGWDEKPDGTGGTDFNWTNWIGKAWKYNRDRDTVVYALWEKQSYEVEFLPNEDSVKSDTKVTGQMAKQQFDCGETKKLSDNQFEREGYEFDNWNSKSDGSGDKTYKDNEPVTDIAEAGTTLSLYAQWKPIEYDIIYDKNEDSIVDSKVTGSTPSSHHIYDKTKTLSDCGFKANGYIFSGWSTDPNGNGTLYNNIESVTNLTNKIGDKITLYAHWTPINYTIVYHPVAPTYSQSTVTGTMENTNCTYGLNYNFRKNTFGLNNHKFIGWSTRKGTANNELTKKDIVYQDKQPFKNLSSANGAVINLYPVWDEAPTIKTKYRKFLKNKDVDKNKLLKYVTSDDREDGDLTNKVVIKQIKYSDRVDTSPTKLDTSVVTDDIIVTVTVTDSQGNTTEQVFYVSIYEEAPDITEPAQESEIRFISRTQAEKRYYLKDTSNWKTDAVLNQKIKDSFDSRNGGSEYEYDSSTKRWVKK